MFRTPVFAQLEITDKCNLRCRHCYRFDTKKMPRSKDLAEAKTLKLAQILFEAKIFSLVITGGEPLVRPDLALVVIDGAKKSGISVSVNTNLLLLTPMLLNELRRLKVNSLLISCPASNPDAYHKITRRGNYANFRSKLELLLNADISCMINMVVTRANYRFIRSTAIEMAKLGVKRFSATPASLNVENPDYGSLLDRAQTLSLLDDLKWCDEYLGLSVDSLEPLPKCFYPQWCWQKKYAFMTRSCQAGRMSVSVSNTGDVRPCSHNPIIYGNILLEPLDAIWKKMEPCRIGTTPDFCKQCPSVSICNGACRMNVLAATGTLNGIERFTVGHVKPPEKKLAEADIRDNSTIGFNGKLYFRKETNEHYTVSSKNNGRNLTIVNKELFLFIEWLEKSLPLTLEELKKTCLKTNRDEAFYKTIRNLIQRGFIKIIP